jgi:Na+-translocating ferredoxin:NAD+ oxidoreductase RnfD subunit
MLLIAAVILLFRRDISAGAFMGTMIGYAVMSAISPCAETFAASLKLSVCTNMVLFSAIYIISDRRIAPQKNYYAVFYGFFIAVVAYVITVTSAKENAIVIVSVLFTPVALGLKNLEKKIELAKQDDMKSAKAVKEVPADVQ